ncbi:MAG: type II toxin-antitoxin system RelE/ParE family toxin [Planctomycetes bacterium]|nr:type II toxin-antitoxin system RelE/ParE family toxin [Planctomycetota bacterium]
MLPVNYLPGARRDFDESFDWYADRSAIAAERFANAVDAAMLRIAQDSRMLTHVDGVHQECPVKRFPFRIIFRHAQDQILIVAIAHAKRRPNYWQSRT